MKNFISVFFAILVATLVGAQNIDKNCSSLTGSTASIKVVKGKLLNLTFAGSKKSNVLDLLKNSNYTSLSDPTKKQTFEKLVRDSLTLGKTLENEMKPSDLSEPNGPFKLSVKFKVIDSCLLLFKCSSEKADFIKITLQEKETDNITKATGKDTRPFEPVTFISPEIMNSIQNSNTCNLCDMREFKPINNRSEGEHPTEYIVVFDPMLSKDGYTICKHIFKKKSSILQERYRKVSAKWFAPSVGSRIRFEIVNQPLTETRKITIDAVDLFNNGSTQFQGIINSQVNTQIIGRLNPPAGTPAVKATESTEHTANQNSSALDMTTRPATDEEKLQMLHSQLIDYISVFRLSSCTIEDHLKNLPKIILTVNKAFGTTAVGVTTLSQQLKSRFADSTSMLNIVDEIGNLFNLLKDLKPLAYTTIRAKNRDYLLVKTFDGNNTEISNENIRLSGGMKIDYSAGFVLTGLRDFTYKLKNATVRYNPLDNPSATRDTTGNVIIKEDEGKNNVGVGILTHFYPRISSHYNVGGTVGLMTSTNLDLRLMLGGSFMVSSLFGSNNRISFSYGRVWGKVARLSTEHEDFFNKPRVINNVPQFYSQAAAPSPIQKNEGSWFFAITMNFGGN